MEVHDKDDSQNISPSTYFTMLKEKKHQTSDEQLQRVYSNCLELLSKYRITGQKSAIRKLLFQVECIERERDIISMGIDTFIYRDDIEQYIDDVASDIVKIIELENYEREIPDDIVSIIAKIRDKFDQLYVVFTDYTGEVERKVEKERREKDPILFGTFQDKKSGTLIDRFYYIADWVDEYCDLTFEKMVDDTQRVGKRNIAHVISTPQDITELKQQLSSLIERNDGNFSKFIISDVDVKTKKLDKSTSFVAKITHKTALLFNRLCGKKNYENKY